MPAGYSAPPPYPPLRVRRHLQTLSVLWLIYGAWTVVTWLVALPFLTGFLWKWHQGPWGPQGLSTFPHLNWLAPLITVLVVARAALSAATGFGLMRRASWGRTLALVAAFLTIFKPITGTALAIYTLWVLIPAESAREYESMADARV